MNAPLVGTPTHAPFAAGRDLFKTVSSHWPSGVAVITATADDRSLHGLTMSAVIALSLDPMQYLISVDKTSNTLPVLKATRRFCINFLSSRQQDVCMLFASKAADKFASVSHRISDTGLPLIEGAVSHIVCDVNSVISSGDHEIMIGDVRDIEHAGGDPLIHFKRSFHTVQPG
ncbi:putative Flavin-dependent monooxygenase, reductase subunit HsaB [Mesorhizobium plurifarium]|uniref:Putative Flavin-dependent monooxygenase, reductase subunit HsaB n=1 Tax=Mesorhizobium plurifarium TaxID=69974 RepID=A0A090GTU1_MESPL|nr:putative Flavin-dependent monooxygenase, reductase subunit HsaB [Mesorhizobium plurifarium]